MDMEVENVQHEQESCDASYYFDPCPLFCTDHIDAFFVQHHPHQNIELLSKNPLLKFQTFCTLKKEYSNDEDFNEK